jgi:hypothetical protein
MHLNNPDCYPFVQEAIRKDLYSGLYSDMNFIFQEGEPVPAHQAIVCSRCDSLKQQLEAAKKSGTMPQIKVNFKREPFLAFLNMLYTDRIPFDLSNETLTQLQVIFKVISNDTAIFIIVYRLFLWKEEELFAHNYWTSTYR